MARNSTSPSSTSPTSTSDELAFYPRGAGRYDARSITGAGILDATIEPGPGYKDCNRQMRERQFAAKVSLGRAVRRTEHATLSLALTWCRAVALELQRLARKDQRHG